MSDFAKKVWDTLSQIDVTPFVETMQATPKRPAMRYVPWHRAWTLLMQQFPGSTYLHCNDIHQPDGTVEVEVEVLIREGDEVYPTRARLGVMDQHFRAIPNPDARDINDNRQRALVKALAFAGLGLNLWDGTDVPVGYLGKPLSAEQVAELEEWMKLTGTDAKQFLKWAEAPDLESMSQAKFNSGIALLKAKQAMQEGK